MNYRPVLPQLFPSLAVWIPRASLSFTTPLACRYVLLVNIVWFHVKLFLPAFSSAWFSWPGASRERQVVVWAVSLHGLGERGAIPWPRGRPGGPACRFQLGLAPRSEGPGPCKVPKEPPAASPHARALCHRGSPSRGRGQISPPSEHEPDGQPGGNPGRSRAAYPRPGGDQGQEDGSENPQGQPQGPAVPDTSRHKQQHASRAHPRRVRAGGASGAGGCGRPGHQVGVCLRPSPGRTQRGVGGGSGGVGGRVPAAGPVGVGRGGDAPPGGADLFVGQVRPGLASSVR